MSIERVCQSPPSYPEVIGVPLFMITGIVSAIALRYGCPLGFSRAISWTYLSTASLYLAMSLARFMYKNDQIQELSDGNEKTRRRVENGTTLLIRAAVAATIIALSTLSALGIINTYTYVRVMGYMTLTTLIALT